MSKRAFAIAFCIVLCVLWARSAEEQEFDSRAESDLVRLTNHERESRGIPALQANDNLRKAARAHARLLAQYHALSHQFAGEEPLRARVADTGLRFDRSAENVALDSGGAEAAHMDLMNSPPHRANILDSRYNAVGIGAVWNDGIFYVAEDFAHVLPEWSALDIENAVAERLGRRGNAHNEKLRDAACQRGRDSKILPKDLFALFPNMHRAFLFSLTEPGQLPDDLMRMGKAPGKYAMGACFVKSQESPEGIFWVALVIE